MDRIRAADRPWAVLRQAIKLHVMFYRATRGLIGDRLPGGLPVLLLDHVGAKSAVKRTTPLVYVSDGENIVIVASKGGDPRHPSWFHNLRANPSVTVELGDRSFPARAVVTAGEERDRLYGMISGGASEYEKNTDRVFPVVVLEGVTVPA